MKGQHSLVFTKVRGAVQKLQMTEVAGTVESITCMPQLLQVRLPETPGRNITASSHLSAEFSDGKAGQSTDTRCPAGRRALPSPGFWVGLFENPV